MAENGDRVTPDRPHGAWSDWREQDFGDLATNEALRYVQAGMHEMSDAVARLASSVRLWRETDDARVRMAAELAAEGAYERAVTRLVREVSETRERLEALEGGVASVRDSQSEIEERVADVERTGPRPAVTTHVHVHKTAPPDSEREGGMIPSPPPVPMLPKRWQKRHKVAAWLLLALVVMVAAAVKAWKG